jgi:DNA recombination protein RmuC
VLTEHLTRAGTGLERAVDAYNAAIGSLDNRVLVTARRFTELGISGSELLSPAPVRGVPRQPVARTGSAEVKG